MSIIRKVLLPFSCFIDGYIHPPTRIMPEFVDGRQRFKHIHGGIEHELYSDGACNHVLLHPLLPVGLFTLLDFLLWVCLLAVSGNRNYRFLLPPFLLCGRGATRKKRLYARIQPIG